MGKRDIPRSQRERLLEAPLAELVPRARRDALALHVR